MTRGTGTYATAGMLDVDAILDGDFQEIFSLGSHKIPLPLRGVSKAFRILKNELHGHYRRPVILIIVSHVH